MLSSFFFLTGLQGLRPCVLFKHIPQKGHIATYSYISFSIRLTFTLVLPEFSRFSDFQIAFIGSFKLCLRNELIQINLFTQNWTILAIRCCFGAVVLFLTLSPASRPNDLCFGWQTERIDSTCRWTHFVHFINVRWGLISDRPESKALIRGACVAVD